MQLSSNCWGFFQIFPLSTIWLLYGFLPTYPVSNFVGSSFLKERGNNRGRVEFRKVELQLRLEGDACAVMFTDTALAKATCHEATVAALANPARAAFSGGDRRDALAASGLWSGP